MNASSQTPPEALPPESAPGRRPLLEPVPLQAVLGTIPAMPATPTEAVTAVVSAEMGKDAPVTARDIARAEVEAGIVFDPARIQAAADAARQQGHAEGRAEAREEFQAELDERGRQLAAVAGSARQRDAVLRLLEGRPGWHHLPVALLAAAAEYGTTPYDAMPPMTLKWNGGVHLSTGTAPRQAVVECETPYGTRADLVVEDPDRQALANLLDLEVVLDIHAPCPHSTACGAPGADLDASDPGLFGWACIDFAGLDDGPRWYCSPPCIFRAQARAGEKLAAIDDQLELDGGL